jgi:hypothetical protein
VEISSADFEIYKYFSTSPTSFTLKLMQFGSIDLQIASNKIFHLSLSLLLRRSRGRGIISQPQLDFPSAEEKRCPWT